MGSWLIPDFIEVPVQKAYDAGKQKVQSYIRQGQEVYYNNVKPAATNVVTTYRNQGATGVITKVVSSPVVQNKINYIKR
jgi:hypothetical protein